MHDPRAMRNLYKRHPSRFRLMLLTSFAAMFACSCSAVTAVGVHFLYRRAELPPAQIVRELCYVGTDDCDTGKHRLDFYLPASKHWPVVVFIHGGNWDSGDKSLRVGGADVYANIGRYFATQGIGVAVINYRLQPATDWRAQVDDARQAVRWVHAHAATYGGRPDALFVMGHSAGGYLAAFVALDSTGDHATPVQGAICVSGAGLDLSDARTYALGEDPRYYAKRFQSRDTRSAWQAVASPVHYAHPGAPPFLILFAGGEKPALQRQARVLEQALNRVGVENSVVVVPGESHSRMVLTLSRPDKHSVPAIMAFIHAHTPGAQVPSPAVR